MFMSMISKCFQLQPEKLPPTERAAYYHSLRVHVQVCQWKSLQLDVLDATKWGWTLHNGLLVPIKTDILCAPEWLLKFVQCNCKLSSKNPCGTRLCTCIKNGLSCVHACGDCRGELCNNNKPQAVEICELDELEDPLDDDFSRNIFDDIFE